MKVIFVDIDFERVGTWCSWFSMPDCHSGGREFESRRPRHFITFHFVPFLCVGTWCSWFSMPDCHSGGREFESRRPRHLIYLPPYLLQGEFVLIIILVSLLWMTLTYEYGIESFIVLFFLNVFFFIIRKRFSLSFRYKINFRLILTFVASFFASFLYSFKLSLMVVLGNIHRGIYEINLEDVSSVDLFFLSTSITIIPNTIYLGRVADNYIVHKIASNKVEAHTAESIYFLKKEG